MRKRSFLAATSDDDLVERAKQARLAAHAPYSNFEVGAAILATDGRVFTGCNIENSTYGLTMCAERVAMFKALSEGHRVFVRVAVVADTAEPTPPCGACRQVLAEFGLEQRELARAARLLQAYELDFWDAVAEN